MKKLVFNFFIFQKYKPDIFSIIYPPPTIPETVSKDLIFPFTYMYVQYLLHLHPPNNKKRKGKKRKNKKCFKEKQFFLKNILPYYREDWVSSQLIECSHLSPQISNLGCVLSNRALPVSLALFKVDMLNCVSINGAPLC
jgi:hypothetical protein